MREYIGTCSCCCKEIFCFDGFLNGVFTEDKKLICFDCEEKDKKEKIPQS